MAEPSTTQTAAQTAAEIAKQILDKLSDAARAAQTTAEAALPHVVKAYMGRQLGYFIMTLLIAVLGALMLRRALKDDWVVPYSNMQEQPTRWLWTGVLGIVFLVAGISGLLVNVGATVGVLVDPLGMFILDLIGK